MSACTICGRGLTDSTSIQRGIGPICWRRLHPEAAARSRRAQPRRRSTHPSQMELIFADASAPVAPIENDGLDIPEFLRRTA